MKSTKIVCTIGPSCQEEKVLTAMVEAGMNVARLNFSHGTYECHKKTIDLVRAVSSKTNKYIGALIDLQGPKIRTGKLIKEKIELKQGESLILTTEEIDGDRHSLSVNYKPLPKEVKAGEKILLDDGNIELKVTEVIKNTIVCKILNGGFIRSFRGINLPDTKISASSLTEKDIKDLEFGLKNDVDFVALSFVRKAKDIIDLKKRIKDNGKETPVIAKIEKPEAIKNIDAIIKESDGIMVARGDLGAETSPEDVPILQKQIINKCNKAGKPVITATQMLESMINKPRPTRAEATDVANAIFDGTDAVMLSGETAIGKYPVESVTVMTNIAKRAEKEIIQIELVERRYASFFEKGNITSAVSYSACRLANSISAKYLISFSLSGKSTIKLSKYRPSIPIIAMSPNETTLRRLSMFWGVHGMVCKKVATTEELLDLAETILLHAKLCRRDDLVIMVSGVPVMQSVETNMIKVHQVNLDRRNL